MNENTEVMAIRIPKDLAAKIREVSKAQNTRLGTALKFIIEQATYDDIEEKLIGLKCTVNKIAELLEKETGAFTKDYLSRMITEEKLQGKFADTLSLEEKKEILTADHHAWVTKWSKKLANFMRPYIEERLKKDREKIRRAEGLEKHIRPDKI